MRRQQVPLWTRATTSACLTLHLLCSVPPCSRPVLLCSVPPPLSVHLHPPRVRSCHDWSWGFSLAYTHAGCRSTVLVCCPFHSAVLSAPRTGSVVCGSATFGPVTFGSLAFGCTRVAPVVCLLLYSYLIHKLFYIHHISIHLKSQFCCSYRIALLALGKATPLLKKDYDPSY